MNVLKELRTLAPLLPSCVVVVDCCGSLGSTATSQRLRCTEVDWRLVPPAGTPLRLTEVCCDAAAIVVSLIVLLRLSAVVWIKEIVLFILALFEPFFCINMVDDFLKMLPYSLLVLLLFD